ncbi:mucin-2-like [Maniola hyperantus]|uniref:mucin-2-like n=1 Tax=Aphantopus hyperantus TaxID=2795564 RepID=UPI00374801D9
MFTVALLVGTLTALAAGRIYERCELARDLQLLGVDRDQIATWVCIAYHESRYDTAARNHGSGDHGLLQISELYWCGPGKACGAPCSAFRDEDISDDVKCALQIYREHTRLQGDGFLAWVVYPHYCKQNAKKYIVDCDKNVKTSLKFEDRARLLKTADTRQESKRQFASDPSRNAVTPRYLSINSIFQGSYVDEFERDYYDNNKQSNWLNFKVDNIDELELPGVVSEKQRSYFIESTTRPTAVTKFDPALIGIKPPSPRKIESNQFRRRKTFSEPLFLKNRFSDDQKVSKTTPAPLREYSQPSLSLNEDLSHNIFLNLSPSVISKSLREFSSHEIKSTDFSRYHVKAPQLEESSSSAVLSYDDLAQNPFLNSLPGLNFKSTSKLPFRATDLGQNNNRAYTGTTSEPIASLRSSKQIGWHSNIPESSETALKTDEDDTKISIADLVQNPFLSHLLHVNNTKPSTVSKVHETNSRIDTRKDFSFTTARPTTKLTFYSSPKDDFTLRREQLEISTKTPITVQRGRSHYLSNVVTENPSTERSTFMYSTRRYQTISRQRYNTNPNDLKSTTAIEPITDKPKVSTAKPYTNEVNWRRFQIETTTSRSTTTKSESLYDVTKSVPQSTSTTEITSKLQTTRPEAASRISTLNKTKSSTSRPQVTSSTKTVSISQTNNPQDTRRLQTTTRLGITSRPQTINKTETASRPHTSRFISILQTTKSPQTTRLQTTSSTIKTTSRPDTTSRPLTTSRLPTTNRPVTTSKPQIKNSTDTISLPQTTRKPETVWGSWLTSRQTTSRPETTSRPSPTLRSWSSWRSWEESRKNTSTTPRPSFTWRRSTNSTLSSTTTNYFTTQKPISTSTQATTAKTTQSIFDLYLRPSMQSSFKPFEFTNRLRKSISIFSGGTTRPPPAYFTSKKPTTEEVPRN